MAVSTASWVRSAVDAVGDDRLRHQRAHGVVEQHVALVSAERLEGAAGRVVAGDTALDDLGDLVVTACSDDRAYGIEVTRSHQDDDLVDHR